eukprot:GFUD01032189.1.p1 GENE.GFUD01032189.1~~GFUD01032189.1.p1  ORF type:complete len:414 (+),score=144.83 GFUD01032189.1:73-1314(+)
MEENVEELIQEAVEAAGVNADLDQDIENELNNLANNPQLNAPLPLVQFPLLPLDEAGAPPSLPPPTGESIIIIEQDEHNTLQEFASSIREAASLFSTYNKCLRLIESSASPTFLSWDKLRECVVEISHHPRVSDKMKMRCLLINKDNVKTFSLLQNNFQLELDNLFYMGKMNLLHISCDTGWDNLARELVFSQGMDVNLCCPSLHMRPACLTPLMLAVGAGHIKVVEVLVQHRDMELEMKDSYGMTAVFHTCNHGFHRVGDQHGYFRRLWSWDLSQQQLDDMETLARNSALPILRLLIREGVDLYERDKTGASILTRAASVDNFAEVIEFLVEAGCRVTENVLNWTRVRNPGVVDKVERGLRVPGSLRRQSRTKIWKLLRAGRKGGNFKDRLRKLTVEEELPGVLSDYIQCVS